MPGSIKQPTPWILAGHFSNCSALQIHGWLLNWMTRFATCIFLIRLFIILTLMRLLGFECPTGQLKLIFHLWLKTCHESKLITVFQFEIAFLPDCGLFMKGTRYDVNGLDCNTQGVTLWQENLYKLLQPSAKVCNKKKIIPQFKRLYQDCVDAGLIHLFFKLLICIVWHNFHQRKLIFAFNLSEFFKVYINRFPVVKSCLCKSSTFFRCFLIFSTGTKSLEWPCNS